jgi:hypothetical protein
VNLNSKSDLRRHFRCTASKDFWLPSRKALLLRVDIDRGTGGALAPIFRDGTFEYVPIPEAVPTRCSITYATLPGRHASPLATVLPARLAGRHPHIDPDFKSATYGDAAPRKRQQLLRLNSGDLLVFYAGLATWPSEDMPRLFAIGFLYVKQVHQLSSRDIDRSNLRRRFGQTAHFLRRIRDRSFAFVEGQHAATKLFVRAIPLGDGRDCLLRDLGSFGHQGSLMRAVGHWIGGPLGLRSLRGVAAMGTNKSCRSGYTADPQSSLLFIQYATQTISLSTTSACARVIGSSPSLNAVLALSKLSVA